MAESRVVSFRAPQHMVELLEKMAKAKGQSISTFLLYNMLDQAMNFEATRQIDMLSDFSSLLEGRIEIIAGGKDLIRADEIKQAVKDVYLAYTQGNRQTHFLNHSKNYCKTAMDCYMFDYAENFGGLDGFIINNCLVKIYDTLYQMDIITKAEHEEKTQFYTAYMSMEGEEILKQSQQE